MSQSQSDSSPYIPLIESYFCTIAETFSSLLLLEHLPEDVKTVKRVDGHIVLLNRLCVVVLAFECERKKSVVLEFLFVRDRTLLQFVEGCPAELRLKAEFPCWHLAMVAVSGPLLEWLECPKNIIVISDEELAELLRGSSSGSPLPIVDKDLVFDRLQQLYRYTQIVRKNFDVFRRAELLKGRKK